MLFGQEIYDKLPFYQVDSWHHQSLARVGPITTWILISWIKMHQTWSKIGNFTASQRIISFLRILCRQNCPFRSEAGVCVNPWTNLETDTEMWSQCASEISEKHMMHMHCKCQLASSISLPPSLFQSQWCRYLVLNPVTGMLVRRLEASKPRSWRPVSKSYHAVSRTT